MKQVALMQQETMANNEENRALKDYATPVVTMHQSGIRRPAIQANNFEIKTTIIQMIPTSIQFSGLLNDDPNAHIAYFLEICNTFKHNGVTDDALRLRCFLFSLRDKAKIWLNSLPTETIITWEDLGKKVLAKFFPPMKTTKF